ncbi:MAG: ATP-binding cassette domain-containing protein, partial [Actinomycetota bacterium]|nr:ATP-binding cassette domain-containing protein [Actinomycetota bacterium]
MNSVPPSHALPLLRVVEVHKSFRRGSVMAARGVSFEVMPGEAVGLVGRSGAGKTSLARILVGLTPPDAGEVVFEGRDTVRLDRVERRRLGRRIHLIFQDPYASLPPAMRVADIVAEPLVIHGPKADVERRVLAAMADVALAASYVERLPGELSGGERQRVALARAIITRPRLIIADEPTAMLDPSIGADLLRTMGRLRDEHGVAWLHITHDLALAAAFCSRLLVLDGGRIVESGDTARVLRRPAHPRTRELVQAIYELHTAL